MYKRIVGGRDISHYFYFDNNYLKIERMKKKPTSKFEYSGSLEGYQIYRNNLYTKYEVDTYSPYQNARYKRALYGLKGISKKELDAMCSKKKKRISNVHYRAQKVLNLFKQERLIAVTNNLFNKWFPDTEFTKFMLNSTDTDPKFRNSLNFKDLNIDKKQIIRIFMNEGILPQNFSSLKEAPPKLPSLKK